MNVLRRLWWLAGFGVLFFLGLYFYDRQLGAIPFLLLALWLLTWSVKIWREGDK